MKSKRFLMVASHADSLIGFRWPLIESLKSKGLEVHLASPGLNEKSLAGSILLKKGFFIHEIPMQRTGLNPFFDIKTIVSLFFLMKRISPYWVMSYTIKPVVYGSIAAWMARVPFKSALITGLGYSFNEQSKSGFLKVVASKLYGISLSKVERIFFQNNDDQDLFYKLNILNKSKSSIVVNGSGVDVEEFSVAPLPLCNQGDVSFLMIARLLGAKGVREYVEAARNIKAEYPKAIFRLVGYLDENPDSIKKSELDGWIEEGLIDYWGKLSDVRPAIAASCVYVLPSYREGTPRTVLEAMSMGRAIITTDAPGCRQTVIDGRNGFIVPVKSTLELAEAMENFLKNPELISEMGRESRKFVIEKYDVKKVNNVFIKYLEVE